VGLRKGPTSAVPGFKPVAIIAFKLCAIKTKNSASVRSGPFSQSHSQFFIIIIIIIIIFFFFYFLFFIIIILFLSNWPDMKRAAGWS